MTSFEARRIRALLDRVGSRITLEHFEDVAGYIRANELELAVHILGEYLDEQNARLSPSEWDTFSELAEAVGIAPRRFDYLRADPS